MIDFRQYLPQRIFLVQGDQDQHALALNEVRQTCAYVHDLAVSRFTVENAREVAEFAIQGDGTERALVVYFSLFSPDAAQVLLKSLEEPDPLTTIVFVTPYPYVVPLTIRSRVALVHTDRVVAEVSSMTKAEVLEYVKKEFGSESEEDAATRKASAIAFLDRLELSHKNNRANIEIIYRAKDMLIHANMPTKYVMEYIASMVG